MLPRIVLISVILVLTRYQFSTCGFIDINIKENIVHGKSLPDVFITRKTSISFVCCLQACDNIHRCKSINYYPSMKLCDINYKDDSGTALKKTTNAVYVRRDSLISELMCENKLSIGSVIDCEIPDHPANGNIKNNYGSGLFSKVIFECNTHYVPVGRPVIGCQDDEIWSYRDFQCKEEAPAVDIPQESYRIVLGDNVALECDVTSFFTITLIYWQYLEVDGSFTDKHSKHWSNDGMNNYHSDLHIYAMKRSDAGNYRCVAKTVKQTATSKWIDLHAVGDIPNVVITTGTSLNVVSGSTVTMGCSISATPDATSVSWQRTTDGNTSIVKSLDSSIYSDITLNDSSFTINYVLPHDKGSYKCVATNVVGTGYSPALDLHVTVENRCTLCLEPFTCYPDKGHICVKYFPPGSDGYDTLKKKCVNAGGSLVKIESVEKHYYVKSVLDDLSIDKAWMQGQRVDGIWQFDDGSTIEYFKSIPSDNEDKVLLEIHGEHWHYKTLDKRDIGAMCEMELQ